jgi:hypothetical protein
VTRNAVADTLNAPLVESAALRRVVLTAAALVWTLIWWWQITRLGQHGDLTWYTANPAQPYSGGVAEEGSYLYSPAFMQILAPLRLLPFEAIIWVWGAVMLAALAYCAGRLAALLILLPPIMGELAMSNVHLLFAAAIVIGFRWPIAWSLILLTKITPGVGLIWFAVRREWRNLALALGATAAIATVSLVAAPDLWAQWLALLTDGTRTQAPPFQANAPIPIPLLIRLPVAAAIVAWGAHTDRRWTVPIAVTLALPVIWTGALSILIAVIPLLRRQPEPRP